MGLAVAGSCYDLRAWFQQIAVRPTERWEQACVWRGGFFLDTRVVMGAAGSADTGMRVALVIAAIALGDLDREFAELLAERTDCPFGHLHLWCRYRLERVGNETRQARPYILSPHQCDFPSAVVQELATRFDTRVRATLIELNVPLNGKEAPFAPSFDATGGVFNLGKMTVRERSHPHEKYVEMAERLLRAHTDGEHMILVEFESFVGLHEWICQFRDRGTLLSNTAHVALAHARKKRTARISAALAADFRRTLSDLNSVPLVVSQTFLHDRDNVYCDASLRDGWGATAGPFYAFGAWDPATVAATATLDISISPLELLTVGFLIRLVAQCFTREIGTSSFVGRSDNELACSVVTLAARLAR